MCSSSLRDNFYIIPPCIGEVNTFFRLSQIFFRIVGLSFSDEHEYITPLSQSQAQMLRNFHKLQNQEKDRDKVPVFDLLEATCAATTTGTTGGATTEATTETTGVTTGV